MTAAQIVLICVVSGFLFLILLWLFLIAPRARKKSIKPFLRPYAHRGLWGKGIPENSLTAFRLAAEHGFAIELDVQLSADGEVFVFHDYTLMRMCGVEGELSDLTAEQLKTLVLNGTEEKIPTLKEVLNTVEGRVPLLIELKGEDFNADLCPATAAVLADYKGLWCVESFNPILLYWFKKHRKDVVRGLLSTNLLKDKKKGSTFLNFALSALWLTFLCRPAFHAWDKEFPHRVALRVGTSLLGAASLVYTIKNKMEYDALLAKGHYPIFDEFIPQK